MSGAEALTAKPTGARLGALATRFAREVAYLTLALATSILAFAAWVAGLSVALSFAVFIVGIPVAVAVFAGFRLVVGLDRLNAAVVLGAPIRASYRPRPAAGLRSVGGWLERVRVTFGDPQSWRDLAWLIVHSIVGFAFGIAAITLVGTTLGLATLPAWEWAVPDDVTVVVPWRLDSPEVVWATWPLAIPAAALTVALCRAMALGHVAIARALLGRGEAELERRVVRLEETRAGP